MKMRDLKGKDSGENSASRGEVKRKAGKRRRRQKKIAEAGELGRTGSRTGSVRGRKTPGLGGIALPGPGSLGKATRPQQGLIIRRMLREPELRAIGSDKISLRFGKNITAKPISKEIMLNVKPRKVLITGIIPSSSRPGVEAAPAAHGAALNHPTNLTSNMPEPRVHHQYFSHKALPQLAFQEKKKFLQSAETQGDIFMEHLWDNLGHDLQPQQRMNADLIMKCRKHGAVRAVVTFLPPAEAVGEAYYCVFAGIEQQGIFGRSLKTFHYFLLERAPDHRGRVRTRFVEILPKTMEKVDIGPGCLPDSDDFWRYTLRYLETGKLPMEGGPMGIK